jgi:Cu(I)-responsive transcriptional regulator
VNIGAASAASGVSAKMIRHYEAIGLLRPASRQENRYRDYGNHDVHELARKLGFSMAQISALLALWRDKERPSREVKHVAECHLADLERRVEEMQTMATALRRLVRSCRGDDRPECPILDDLALGGGHHGAAPASRPAKRGTKAGASRM